MFIDFTPLSCFYHYIGAEPTCWGYVLRFQLDTYQILVNI
jgi:hypothetical protein